MVDISQIVSTRLSAMRKLQDNPHDSEAIKSLHNAQKEVTKNLFLYFRLLYNLSNHPGNLPEVRRYLLDYIHSFSMNVSSVSTDAELGT